MMLVLRSEIDILHGNNTPASEGKADFTNIKLGAKLSVPEGKPATGDKLGSSLTEDEGLLLGSWVSLEGTELGIVLTGKGTPDTGEELTGTLLLPTLLGTALDMDGLEELPPTPTDTGKEVEGATDPLPGLGATLSVPEGPPATGDKLGSSLTPSSLTEDEGAALAVSSCWPSLGRGEGLKLSSALEGITLGCW